MGTPVSKPVNGKSFEAEEKTNCATGPTLTHIGEDHNVCKQNQDQRGILPGSDTDDPDIQEWADEHQRLKTNRNGDLHVLNTRFNIASLEGTLYPDNVNYSLADGSVGSKSGKPTNSNSRVQNDIDLFVREENNASSACDKQNDATGDGFLGSFYKVEEPLQDYALLASSIDEKHLTGNDKDNDNIINEPYVYAQDDGAAQYLQVFPDVRGVNSPVPKSLNASFSEDCIDPFEGLEIPRQRVYSFGSVSVYSVKEISDEQYQKYMSEVKSCIRSYGFFEEFPTPALVSEAQKIYRRLNMPAPVDEDGNLLPHPSKITMQDFLSYLRDDSIKNLWERVENMSVHRTDQDQLFNTVEYLCKGLDNDIDKLKVLSCWVVREQFLRNPILEMPEATDTWCKLFKKMCKYTRIKTKLIKGSIRALETSDNDVTQSKGCWLALLVNYTWVLVDPVVRIKTEHQMSVNEADQREGILNTVEQMFRDPEEFIFTHFPDDEHWQFLARPVTKDEWPNLAVVHQCFFRFHMAIVNFSKATIVAESAEICISLSFAEESKPLTFRCDFRSCDQTLECTHARRYVFLETNLKNRVVKMRLRFPERGAYTVNLFVSSDGENWNSTIFYKLIYRNDFASEPYPENSREEWGPGLDATKLGLAPVLYHSGEILMQKSVLQVAFHDQRCLQFKYVLLMENKSAGDESAKVSLLKDKNNDVIFVVDMEPTVTGIFTLQLFARENRNGEFCCFCNYLIRKEKSRAIPKLEFPLKDVVVEKRTKQTPESGYAQISIDTSGFLQIIVELKLTKNPDLNFSDHARHWIVDSQCFIDINFPRKGKYLLKVQGRCVKKGQIRTIREEMFIVNIPSKKWSCFPKVGNRWNSWYKIEAPLSHHLQEKDDIAFKVEIRDAQDVAVLGANGWFHLDRLEESWSWVGQVETGPKSTKCRLLARFEIGSDKWSDLLWFKIMSVEDMRKLDQVQEAAVKLANEEPGSCQD